MFVVSEKFNTCNFADGNIPISYGNNLPLILSKLGLGMENLLYWFRINSIQANPGKFRLMIIGKKDCFTHNAKVGSINIKESDVVELLEITIDKDLKQIENLCRNRKHHLHALRWIRKCLTIDKGRLLGNAFIDSQFNYAQLIWVLCHKTLYLEMQKIHHKSLKVIYESTTIKQQCFSSGATFAIFLNKSIHEYCLL